MKAFLKSFVRDESGASAAEYALILAVVGVAIGAGALVLGQNVSKSIANAAENVAKCGTKANATSATLPGYDSSVTGDECNTAGG